MHANYRDPKCAPSEHRLATNIMHERRNDKQHSGTMYCQKCGRSFTVEQFDPFTNMDQTPDYE